MNVPKYRARLAFILAVLSLLTGITLSMRQEPPHAVCELSLILHTKTTAGDTMLQAGALRAADECKANLSVITLAETGDADEQYRLAEREIAGGTQAVILSCADREGSCTAADACAGAGLPLVTITSGCDSAVTAHLSADQYAMGRSLALEAMKRDGQKAVITVVRNAANRTYLEDRLNGLVNIFTTCRLEYEVIDADAQDVTQYGFINRLRQRGTTSVIALDLPELELLAGVFANEALSLYGFDTSSAVLNALDNGHIRALCIGDDFSLGYLAIQTAYAALADNPPPEAEVEHLIIDHDSMYDTRVQWLLFPLQR